MIRWLIGVVRMRVNIGRLINLVLPKLADVVNANEHLDLGWVRLATILVDT